LWIDRDRQGKSSGIFFSLHGLTYDFEDRATLVSPPLRINSFYCWNWPFPFTIGIPCPVFFAKFLLARVSGSGGGWIVMRTGGWGCLFLNQNDQE